MNYPVFKDTSIKGQKISGEVLQRAANKALEAALAGNRVDASMIEHSLLNDGVTNDNQSAYRAADAVIQKLRRTKFLKWKAGEGWSAGPALTAGGNA